VIETNNGPEFDGLPSLPTPGQQSATAALAHVALQYHETGLLVTLADSPLIREPLELVAGSGKFLQIHERLGAGSEGSVFYATLKGTAWGDLENLDVAVKVSHPLAPSKQQALPCINLNSDAEHAALYAAIAGQSKALHAAQLLNGERKISPNLLQHVEFPLPGRGEAVIHVFVMEFVEGESLTSVIEEFQSGKRTDREVVGHIHQSALTLRALLLGGLTNLDSNTDNFLVSRPEASPFGNAVFVDFGGAKLESEIDSENKRDQMRSNSICNFAKDCSQIRHGPASELIQRAVDTLNQLFDGAISLTQATESLGKEFE
jgi:serine/threonine protein kinase